MAKTVFITGASSGIGRAVAKIFLARQDDCGLLARRQERLLDLINPDQSIPPQIFCVDLSQPDQLEKFIEENQEWLATVDVFVNNAGLALGVSKTQESSWMEWEQMLAVNVRASFRLAQVVSKSMAKKGFGTIINVGSVAGHWTYPGGNMYAATKAALHSLTESLRMDLMGTGVRVGTLSPGLVETEFSEVRLKDPIKAKAVYQGMQPLMADDVAASIVWMVDQPPHVNVQEIILFPTDQAAVGQVSRR